MSLCQNKVELFPLMMHSIIIFVEINMTKTVIEFENELVSCDTFVVMPDVSATGEVRS